MSNKNGSNGVPDGLVIDRSRITHGESKKMTLLGITAQRAQRDLDVETMERVFDEIDRMVVKVTVSVPDGWLPEDVTMETDGWLERISQSNYDILVAVSGAQAADKKGA